MEELWIVLYGKLSPICDLWRTKAPDGYKGIAGAPYVVAQLEIVGNDDGFSDTATLTLDGYGFGDETQEKATVEVMADIRDALLSWYVQDSSSTVGSGGPWLMELEQMIEEDDLRGVRLRAVYTSTYVSARVALAYT